MRSCFGDRFSPGTVFPVPVDIIERFLGRHGQPLEKGELFQTPQACYEVVDVQHGFYHLQRLDDVIGDAGFMLNTITKDAVAG